MQKSKNETIILDTNSLLRFLLSDIPEQKHAVEQLLIQAKQSTLFLLVPDAVLFEVHFILDKYYRFDKEQIIEALHVIVSSEYLVIEQRTIFLSALKIYKSARISFVDCFLLAKAKQSNAELFTFDQKLQKLRSQYEV